MFRGFRFALHPTPAQAETLGQWIGVTRLVYNLALEQRRDFWRQYRENEGRNISMFGQCRELTDLRRDFDWIGKPPRAPQEAALNDLDRAFTAFFKGTASYPTTRRLGLNDSLRFKSVQSPFKVLNGKWGAVLLRHDLGWLKFRLSRPIVGNPKTVTVTRHDGKWSVAFMADVGEAVEATSLPAVGIDRGIANTLSLSNGEHMQMADTLAVDRRVRQAQKVLARRKRGSRRYAKKRRCVARLSALRARMRSHWNHVASTDIARRFGLVAVEDLRIAKMTASAKGTNETPGRGVRQKAGLNRSILNQGWGQFAAMLDYKLEAAGGRLIYVPAAYTSQTCSACGVVDAQSRKSQAVFACVHCGHSAHADTNAALEISRRSTSVLLAEGGHLGRPVEPRTLAA